MYFLVNIQHTAAGYPKSIADFSDIFEARSSYHTTLASNYIADLLGFSVILLDQFGNQIAKEFYEKPVEPTPEV